MKLKIYLVLLVAFAFLGNSYIFGQAPILILDFDDNSSSAPSIETSLTNLEADFETMTSIPADLSVYEAVFVCLGIYSNNYELSIAEGQQLADYLSGGGSIYMEGGDTWYFDDPTPVHAMFNINPLADGTSDMSIVNGQSGTFTEGMSFSYTGENNWMDHIAPVAPAFLILENQAPVYGTAVAYDAGTYKTIGAAHEFGGLADGSSPSTKDELMAAYLEFLDVNLAPEAAFSASDTVICKSDFVIFTDESSGNVVTWNWIFEGGTPATSTEQNPAVGYGSTGNFDVFLEVSDGEVTSTMYKSEYIQVSSVPDTGNMPSGITLVCAAWGNTTYNTTSMPGVATYNWKVEPTEAGTVSGTGTSATVIWASGFVGAVELSVAGVNYCGTGPHSDPLLIERYLPDVNLVLPAYVGLPEPPFELTGGTPPGGEYSGPGVSNGMFDPSVAGLGEHTITYTYTDPSFCTNSAQDVITVTPNVGTADLNANYSVKVYPNPNTGDFVIDFNGQINENVDVVLYNALNQPVYKAASVDPVVSQVYSVKTDDLKKGMYYLRITGNHTEQIVKMMITD